MDERAVLLLSPHASSWKSITPFLTGMRVVIGPSKNAPDTNFAVVGHSTGGRVAQQLAVDGGARAMILMGCEILPGREHDLQALDIPVLLLWGEDDIVHTVETAYRLNDLIHRSTLALVPGCGNALPEQAPDTVGPLIADYLRTQWLGLGHGHDHGPIAVDLTRKPPERP
jgi:pimeloyl-ACP methyl ester carboxylesterase